MWNFAAQWHLSRTVSWVAAVTCHPTSSVRMVDYSVGRWEMVGEHACPDYQIGSIGRRLTEVRFRSLLSNRQGLSCGTDPGGMDGDKIKVAVGSCTRIYRFSFTLSGRSALDSRGSTTVSGQMLSTGCNSNLSR